RDFMRILSSNNSQVAESRSHCIASTFNRQLYNVFGIEVDGVGREGSTCCMFYSLVYGQDRHIASIGQSACIHDRSKVAQHLRTPVGWHEYFIEKLRARLVQ